MSETIDVEVHELVRRHQSAGRALLFRMIGGSDVEQSTSAGWIQGASGSRYLDLGSFAVFLLGHNHPTIVAAVSRQLAVAAGTSRVLPNPPQALAAAALAGSAPPGLSKVLLLNSGAEAVEAAIKLARARTGRPGLAHLEGSFHGKTMGALSLTDAPAFRAPAGPLLDGVTRLPRDEPDQAAELIERTRPAAVFAEPVQGEGGVHPLTAAFLTALRRACDATGALLVFDEIQSGLGRCGTFWAHEPSGVRPDVLLTGKALGGGVLPASALVATEDAFQPYDRDPLLHTSTFGGNPLTSAAVLATLAVLEEEQVPKRAQEVGDALRAALDRLVAQWPALFTGVTGRGALLGLHSVRADVAGEFLRAAVTENVLLTPCLTTPEVVRLSPSAFLSPADISFAEQALSRAAARAAAELS